MADGSVTLEEEEKKTTGNYTRRVGFCFLFHRYIAFLLRAERKEGGKADGKSSGEPKRRESIRRKAVWVRLLAYSERPWTLATSGRRWAKLLLVSVFRPIDDGARLSVIDPSDCAFSPTLQDQWPVNPPTHALFLPAGCASSYILFSRHTQIYIYVIYIRDLCINYFPLHRRKEVQRKKKKAFAIFLYRYLFPLVLLLLLASLADSGRSSLFISFPLNLKREKFLLFFLGGVQCRLRAKFLWPSSRRT